MQYGFTAIECKIPQRNTHIHATVVLPQGQQGQKYPLVAYAHGFAGSRHENGGATLMCELLAQKGIASVRMDFAGCGESEESAIHATVLKMTADLAASINYTVANYPIDENKIGVIGNSMGGRVACEYINSGQRKVAAAFLTAPAPRNTLVYGLVGGTEGYAASYAEAKQNGCYKLTTIFGASMELAPEWFEEMLQRDVYAQPSTFTGRMQVIYAADDDVLTPDVQQECAAHYSAELIELSGGGHTFGFYSGNEEVKQRLAHMAQEFFVQSLLGG